MTTPRTDLHPGVHVLPARGETRAVVLVLHGGKANSYEPSESKHLSSMRMKPFAAAVHDKGADDGIAVWRVKYRVRGWNAPELSPVADARWALEEVRRRHGDVPVVLLGHSMGGRTAVHVLGDASVIGMVALCPWLPHEPFGGADGKRVVIAHAQVDRWTSPAESLAWAEQARSVATSVSYLTVRGTGHFMLRRAGLWSDLATGFVLAMLDTDPSTGRTATNVLGQAAAGATTLTV